MKRIKRIIQKFIIPSLLGLAIGGIFFLISNAGVFDNFRFRLTDRFFTNEWKSQDIVIIQIDPKTLRRFGKFQEWSRRGFAKALTQLAKANPKVVGIDTVFQDRSKGIAEIDLIQKKEEGLSAEELETYLIPPHPDDKALAEAIKLLPQSALIRFLDPKTDKAFESLQIINENSTLHGWNNAFPDADGIFRRVPLGFPHNNKTFTPSFSYAMAQTAKNIPSPENIPTDEQKQMFINFSAEDEPFEAFSFADLADGMIHEEKLRGKIIFIGPTDATFHDNHRTPVASGEKLMAGVKIQAAATHTLLTQNFLALQKTRDALITFLVAGLILGFLLGILPFWATGILCIISLPAIFFFGKFMWNHGTIIDVLSLLIVAIAAYFAVLLFRSATERRERKQVQELFGHYVSKELVKNLLQNPEAIKLGGERREITILFSDLQGSTALGEKLSPESLVLLMNIYFTAMTKAIMEEGGTLDKFEGDGIMALFGTPVMQKNHAERALFAALSMQKALVELNKTWSEQGVQVLNMRIGIHAGKAIVGNMGSPERVNYTAMGDAVNVAARLQEFNKELGTSLLFSAETRGALSQTFEKKLLPDFVIQPLGKKQIRGRTQTIELFTFAKFV